MLQRIFKPIDINGVTVPNRIVRTAHGTYLGKGRLTEELEAYHFERARAGVGLSFLELASIHPSSFTFGLHLWDDEIIPEYQRFMRRIQPTGMKVFQQIWHGGAHWPPADGRAAWSASTVQSPWGAGRPRAMTTDDIELLVTAFGDAARRCAEGGLDGCELHYGHGSLLHQFLSPLTNRREDGYGGSLENRMRFGREALASVRKAVPSGFAIGIRISDQDSPGGITSEECAQAVAMLEADGLIDFVNGSHGSYYNIPEMIPPMDLPQASMLPAASTIVAGAKRAVRIVAPARLRTLDEAEQILRDGLADMVSLVRAQIADPDLVSKTKAGQIDRVRPCIACNQGCLAGTVAALRMGCTVNPAVGFEATLSEHLITKTATPRRVFVIGGGPAGMEAARVAALSGHHVTLAEAGSRLGGLINVAAHAPKLYMMADFTDWLEKELYELGVDVRMNTFVDADDVIAESPDAVIVATGSMPQLSGEQIAMPGRPAGGMNLPHVKTSIDLLTGPDQNLGNSALVFDDLGTYEAVAVADFLVERGLDVTFATRFASFAPSMEFTCRNEPALARLQARKGAFRFLPRMQVIRVEEGQAVIKPLQSEHAETVDADTVVMVLGREPFNSIADDLKGRVDQLTVVGDAESARDLPTAVREGHLAGRAIV